MTKVTHYLITNREVVNVKEKNTISVGEKKNEYLKTEGREPAGDNLRFGEISFDDKKDNKKLGDYNVKLYGDLSYEELKTNTQKENIDSAKVLSSNRLFSKIHEKELKAKDDKRDILFFIHGFKNDLSVALNTVAQLHEKYVKPKKSPVRHIVMFSWPAMKAVLEYRDDAKDAELSGYALARAFMKLRRFFRMLAKEAENGQNPFCDANIHLMCHSMGNQVLESMITKLHYDGVALNSLFGEIILVGSDVDYDVFESPRAYTNLIDLGSRIHIYYHNRDRALLVSQNTKNAFNRLGLWGCKNTIALSDDIIQCNVSDIEDTDDGFFKSLFEGKFLDRILNKVGNHWYYINNDLVVNDIIEVLGGKLESAFSDEF